MEGSTIAWVVALIASVFSIAVGLFAVLQRLAGVVKRIEAIEDAIRELQERSLKPPPLPIQELRESIRWTDVIGHGTVNEKINRTAHMADIQQSNLLKLQKSFLEHVEDYRKDREEKAMVEAANTFPPQTQFARLYQGIVDDLSTIRSKHHSGGEDGGEGGHMGGSSSGVAGGGAGMGRDLTPRPCVSKGEQSLIDALSLPKSLPQPVIVLYSGGWVGASSSQTSVPSLGGEALAGTMSVLSSDGGGDGSSNINNELAEMLRRKVILDGAFAGELKKEFVVRLVPVKQVGAVATIIATPRKRLGADTENGGGSKAQEQSNNASMSNNTMSNNITNNTSSFGGASFAMKAAEGLMANREASTTNAEFCFQFSSRQIEAVDISSSAEATGAPQSPTAGSPRRQRAWDRGRSSFAASASFSGSLGAAGGPSGDSLTYAGFYDQSAVSASAHMIKMVIVVNTRSRGWTEGCDDDDDADDGDADFGEPEDEAAIATMLNGGSGGWSPRSGGATDDPLNPTMSNFTQHNNKNRVRVVLEAPETVQYTDWINLIQRAATTNSKVRERRRMHSKDARQRGPGSDPLVPGGESTSEFGQAAAESPHTQQSPVLPSQQFIPGQASQQSRGTKYSLQNAGVVLGSSGGNFEVGSGDGNSPRAFGGLATSLLEKHPVPHSRAATLLQRAARQTVTGNREDGGNNGGGGTTSSGGQSMFSVIAAAKKQQREALLGKKDSSGSTANTAGSGNPSSPIGAAAGHRSTTEQPVGQTCQELTPPGKAVRGGMSATAASSGSSQAKRSLLGLAKAIREQADQGAGGDVAASPKQAAADGTDGTRSLGGKGKASVGAMDPIEMSLL